MDLAEFQRLLGSDPRSQDPAMQSARSSGPEFEQAAKAAERFEDGLERALGVPVPDDLLESLEALPARATERRFAWPPLAIAAGLLIAVGAASLAWRAQYQWDSVPDYVVGHYRHDGAKVLARADGTATKDAGPLLADFRMQAAPAFAGRIDFIKVCPTPGGKGIHMILDSPRGPLTVIYMPHASVNDRQMLDFDGMNAMLVQLSSGSAVVIGHPDQRIPEMYALVRDSITPLTGDPLTNPS